MLDELELELLVLCELVDIAAVLVEEELEDDELLVEPLLGELVLIAAVLVEDKVDGELVLKAAVLLVLIAAVLVLLDEELALEDELLLSSSIDNITGACPFGWLTTPESKPSK